MKKLFFLTVIAITLPLILFAFVGCMKKPENKADYGPEIAFTEIMKAINNQASANIEEVKLGQFVSIDENQTIDVQSPLTYRQRLDEVTSYIKETTVTRYNFHLTLNELVDGKWTPSTSDFPLVVSNAKTESLNSILSFKFSRDEETKSFLTIQSMRKSDSASKQKVTYHNLEEETGIMPIPAAVSKQTDCGGLSPQVCNSGLRYIKVKFDQVVWDSEDHGIKRVFNFTYSPDVPTYIESWDNPDYDLAITKQIKGCVQTWMEIDNGSGGSQTVPVMNCAELRDFQFGHD